MKEKPRSLSIPLLALALLGALCAVAVWVALASAEVEPGKVLVKF